MLISVLTLGTNAFGQFSITGYPPTEYQGGNPTNLAAMRTSLGIDSFIIEDFDELRLPDEGRLHFSGVTDVILENGNSWGETGTGFARINAPANFSVVIQIDGGTPVLGIGFSAFESGIASLATYVSINDETPTLLNSSTLPAFIFSAGIRNGYLIIEAQGSNSIERVELSQTGGLDGYQIDYLAYSGGTNLPPNSSIETAVLFKFQSVLGEAYTIEESPDLENWDDAVTGIVGDGKIKKYFFEATNPHSFYRLKNP